MCLKYAKKNQNNLTVYINTKPTFSVRTHMCLRTNPPDTMWCLYRPIGSDIAAHICSGVHEEDICVFFSWGLFSEHLVSLPYKTAWRGAGVAPASGRTPHRNSARSATVAWIYRNLHSGSDKTNAPPTHLKGKRILSCWLPVKLSACKSRDFFSESPPMQLPRNDCRYVQSHVTHYLS